MPDRMLEFFRIPAGTKLAVDADGKFFAVADDDPRPTFFTPHDHLWVRPAPANIVTLNTDLPVAEAW